MKAAISRAVCLQECPLGELSLYVIEVLQKFMTGPEETVDLCFQRMSEILRK